MPPTTTYEPPPYSWTRERTLNGAGVSSEVEPSAAARTMVRRPPSAGRPSTQKMSSPSIHGSASWMTSPTTSSIRIGERHAPYGATTMSGWGSGPMLPGGHVLGLFCGHRFEHDAERGELEARDLGVDRLGDVVDPWFELGVVEGDVLGRQRLVGEAHVHHGGRMALGRPEVYQPAFGDEVQLLPTEVELLDVLADLADMALGQRPKGGEVQLSIEMAGVGHDRAVAHRLEMLAAEDVDV